MFSLFLCVFYFSYFVLFCLLFVRVHSFVCLTFSLLFCVFFFCLFIYSFIKSVLHSFVKLFLFHFAYAFIPLWFKISFFLFLSSQSVPLFLAHMWFSFCDIIFLHVSSCGEGSLVLILLTCPQMFSPRLRPRGVHSCLRLLVAYILCDVSFILVSCSQLFITVLTDLIFLLLRKTIFLFKQSLNKILSVTPLLPLPVPPVSFLLSPPQTDQSSRASIHHIGPLLLLLYFLPRTLVLNSPLTPTSTCSSLLVSSVPPARLAFKTLLFLSLLLFLTPSLTHPPSCCGLHPHLSLFSFSSSLSLSHSLSLSRLGQPFKVSPWHLLKKNKIWSFSHCQTYFWSLCPLCLGIFSSICLLLLLPSFFLSDSDKSSDWCICCRNCQLLFVTASKSPTLVI